MRYFDSAYAKINLFLAVTGKAEDGYHLLQTVMHSVDLHDTVTISLGDGHGEYSVDTSGLIIPYSKKNIAETAARNFFEFTGIRNPGIHIHIEKRIPAAAGLGGGSADAAAVIRMLAGAFGVEFKSPILLKIAKSVGADVPFCLGGGTALAEGTGEILTPLPDIRGCWFVIVKAGEKKSTAEMYRRLDECGVNHIHNAGEFLDAVKFGSLPRIGELLHNDFARISDGEMAARIREIMDKSGSYGVSLSGSGPSWFGMFGDKESAEGCAAQIQRICRDVFVCSS